MKRDIARTQRLLVLAEVMDDIEIDERSMSLLRGIIPNYDAWYTDIKLKNASSRLSQDQDQDFSTINTKVVH